ncbi:MAG: hypothetical protein ACRD41_15405 [Candidatus Acidiferrales bacterium]
MTDAEPAAIETRLEAFLIVVGVIVAAGAAIGGGLRAGESAAAGGALSWLNFRWLRQGAAGVMRLGLAQAGAEIVKVPPSIHAKFFGRTVLLVIAACAILFWLHLPAIPLLCGLAAIFPAVLLELGYEMARGQHRPDAQ